MNFVFLSPHFPPHSYQFCVHLRELGATVLGISDEPYDALRPELRQALNEYYWVPNMHHYDDLLRGLGYFTQRYGKLDGLDSHSEYWMETEARLRTDFNIPGLKEDDLPAIRRKSRMKDVYRKAGVETPRGRVVRSAEQARRFVCEVGFPLVAKPDIGVGAANTYRFDDLDQLEAFLVPQLPVDTLLEAFVEGRIQTFDGLTDGNGEIVFYSSLEYSQGIMEAVNEDSDVYYYTLRAIPPDLEHAGQRVVQAYNVRKRFFHFEFFRTQEGNLLGLEVNMRPPGGLTTDMVNYANDIDIYYEWANVILHNRFGAIPSRAYHCAYVGRKWNKTYLHSHEEVLAAFGATIVHHEEISGVFSQAMGNYGYLARHPELHEIVRVANFIQAQKGNG
jgi:hypothetical protein